MATSLNISLPEPIKAYVDAAIEDGAYATPSEYIAELISADHDRHRKALEARLVEALKGDSIVLTSEEVERGGVLALLRKKRQDRQDQAA
jgi:antitoxin ParD1/3/4